MSAANLRMNNKRNQYRNQYRNMYHLICRVISICLCAFLPVFWLYIKKGRTSAGD